LPFGSSDRLPRFFTGSPAHVSTLSGSGTRPVSGQLSAHPGLEVPDYGQRFPVAFRPPAFASWASSSRQGVPLSSRSAYQAATTTRPPGPCRGSRVSHAQDAAGVGALFIPGPVVPSRPTVFPRPALPPFQAASPQPRWNIPSTRGPTSRDITEGSRTSPVRPSPHLWSLDGSATLGLHPGLRTPRSPATPARTGTSL